MKKESLSTSMAKLIMVVSLIVGIGAVLGALGYVLMKHRVELMTSCPSTVTDIDNNIYSTIKIGDQCWMKENLKVTKNSAGVAITRYCYDDDLNICDTDGGLYDWNTAMNNSVEEGAQGICPDGWHIPGVSEWQILEKELPVETASERVFPDCVDLKGSWNYCTPEEKSRTKSIQFTDYNNFNLSFSGYYNNSSYYNRDKDNFFWSSLDSGEDVWSKRIDETFYQSTYLSAAYDKIYGFSIRCLKN